jgi:hypothetical protein
MSLVVEMVNIMLAHRTFIELIFVPGTAVSRWFSGRSTAMGESK